MFTFHILWLPHSKIHKDFCVDAFSIKVFNLCKMVKMMGYKIIAYGVEGSNPECDEFVPCLTQEEFASIYPKDWKKEGFDFDNKEGRQIFNDRAIEAINARKREQGQDCILNSYGWLQEPITRSTWLPTIELWIGHPWPIPYTYHVRESYARWNIFLGKWWKENTPSNYDTVIPNYYDLSDFQYEGEKKDYAVYVGRPNHDKGWMIAVDACQETGTKLKLAWQGQDEVNAQIIAKYGNLDLCEHIGFVSIPERVKLVSEAFVCFVPSQYSEPFGGTMIESFLCGTPVISSNFGAFPENNTEVYDDGIVFKTGWRCSHYTEYVDALKDAKGAIGCDYDRCRYKWEKYSIENILPKYQDYFKKIYSLCNWGGWDTIYK